MNACKTHLWMLLALSLTASNLLGQKAPVGSGEVLETTVEVFDAFGSFFDAPVLYIRGTEFDDCCIVSNDGPTGLQIQLNGVDYPINPNQYIYESSFTGREGNDRFIFRAEEFPQWNFRVRGGPGDDFLHNVTSNNFSMSGEEGDDTIAVSFAERTELGEIGLNFSSDFFRTNTFVSILSGGPGDDILFGGFGGVRIYCGDGDDIVNAGEGNDEVFCGAGDDIVFAGPGDDRVFGGAGMDMINGGQGNDWLDSGQYDTYPAYNNQRTVEGDVAGIVVAGPGNDFVQTGPFQDTVNAGTGENSVISPSLEDNVSGSPAIGEDVSALEAPFGSGYVLYYEFSDFGGSSFVDIRIAGTPYKDRCIIDENGIVLNGVRYRVFAEFIEFEGFDGDDIFIFRDTRFRGYGNAHGGRGDDFLSIEYGQISINGDDGNDTLSDRFGTSAFGGEGDDTFHLRNATQRTRANGGAGNDTFYGGNFGNVIFGDAGDDIIYGGDDVDTIYAGIGRDYVYGGDGDDTIDSGIRFGHTEANPDGGDTVYGGPGNDIIKTGYGIDFVFGGDGDDTIESGSGNDRVRGGPGGDTIVLGNGNDWGYGGAGDDDIRGNAGDDVIYGNSGQNTLSGGPGNDFVR